MHAAAGRAAHDERHADAGAVARLRGEVGDHVEGAGDEVGELHLGDRTHPHHRRADRGADDRRLGQRGVHDPLLAEPREQPVRHLEGAAVDADVLAEHEHALVALHLLEDALADRLDVRRVDGRERRGVTSAVRTTATSDGVRRASA